MFRRLYSGHYIRGFLMSISKYLAGFSTVSHGLLSSEAGVFVVSCEAVNGENTPLFAAFSCDIKAAASEASRKFMFHSDCSGTLRYLVLETKDTKKGELLAQSLSPLCKYS